MRGARLITALALAADSGAAWADQFAYLTLPQATAAMQRLATQPTVHAWCAPCGEARSHVLDGRRVELTRVWDGAGAKAYRDPEGRSYWALEIDGEMLDLAYVYVRNGRRWENLALLQGLPAAQVPRELDAAHRGR